jgi:MinD-like ATPase involved in chromosome partitioning or flagellar assembly
MGTIAFASAKASPGVTTTIAALAASWPEDRDLHVAELDPSGGDLAVRFDLAPEPGLVSLAAAGRRDLRVDTFVEHTQALPFPAAEGVERRVLVAPVAADQAVAALGTLRSGLVPVLAGLGGDVLVDCGRLDPGSPVVDVALGADLLVVVVRPVVAEVHHLAARLAALRPRALSLLAVGEAPYPVTEVATAVGAAALGTLADDPRAADALTVDGRSASARSMRRSRLLRDARAVAEGLATWLGPTAAGEAPPAAPPAPEAPAASPYAPPADYAPPRPPLPPPPAHPPQWPPSGEHEPPRPPPPAQPPQRPASGEHPPQRPPQRAPSGEYSPQPPRPQPPRPQPPAPHQTRPQPPAPPPHRPASGEYPPRPSAPQRAPAGEPEVVSIVAPLPATDTPRHFRRGGDGDRERP